MSCFHHPALQEILMRSWNLGGARDLILTKSPGDSEAPLHFGLLVTKATVYPPFTTQLPPTSKLFLISLLFKESLIAFLTIFLNPTSIQFTFISLYQNCSCQHHQWPHFAKSKDFQSLPYLNYSQHLTQLTNLPFWSSSFPWQSPTLLMILLVGSPLSAPLVNCSAPDLRPRTSSSVISFSFVGLNTIYILSTLQLRSLSLTFP